MGGRRAKTAATLSETRMERMSNPGMWARLARELVARQGMLLRVETALFTDDAPQLPDLERITLMQQRADLQAQIDLLNQILDDAHHGAMSQVA